MRIIRFITVMLIVASGAFAVTGFFGSSDADKALQRMHATYVTQIEKSIHRLERPEISRTNASMLLHMFSVEKLFAGTVDLAADLTILHDVRDEKNPLMELATDITLEVDNGYSLETTIGARSVDRSLLLNIGKLVVSAPAEILPAPFVLPAAMQTVWYGATFDELDRLMRENAEEGESTPSAELMIAGAFRGAKVDSDDLRATLQKIHLWNGLEVLPEENGLVRIRTESDKKKIRNSVRAIVRLLEKSTGPSWKTSMEDNAEFQKMIGDLEKNNLEFLREMGTVKGVISADKETFALRGFEGDIFDEQDNRVGHVAFIRSSSGDFSLGITQEKTGETFHLVKQGTQVDLSSNGKKMMTGSVSKEKFSLMFLDEEDGSNVLSVLFDIDSFDTVTGSFRIKNGVITLAEEKIIISVADMTVERKGVNSSFRLEAAGTRDGNSLFMITIDSEQSETAPFTPEKPAYKPFESLQQDLMQALMGGATLP